MDFIRKNLSHSIQKITFGTPLLKQHEKITRFAFLFLKF